ncbi:hypothetical protein EYC80_002270 [Monilinia laxa]|uniref:Uncharacterized protein n=1 Tax=Monilinia laxa TaxID=61186 RepID=A0A5N6K3K1_MONLA|nr:hypothetical protein EYC80_002270 [Monilinia laxa]
MNADLAYNDPNACSIHGYNLEWRTCMTCDIIKLTAQNSAVDFTGISGGFGQSLNPQSATQRSQTGRSIAERRMQHDQQRPRPEVISTTYFSVDNPYDFNTGDGLGDHPENLALTPSDDKYPEDLALSDEEEVKRPQRRRNRLQKRSKDKSGAEVEDDDDDDDDDDMEHLALSDDERDQDKLPQGTRRGNYTRPGTSKKSSVKGRHVKFSE